MKAIAELSTVAERYLPFFVYGTLKPGGANYAGYLGGRVRGAEPAILRNAILVTDEMYPYLIVDDAIARVNDQVQGMLVTVESRYFRDTLQRIDWLEDYKPLRASSLYLRISRVVETDAGPAEAWMYVAGSQVLENARSGRLRKLADGVWSV